MREHDILPMCYSPFSGMKLDERYLVRDPKIVALAQEIGMVPGAMLLSWAVQRGTVPVVRSQVECEWMLPDLLPRGIVVVFPLAR